MCCERSQTHTHTHRGVCAGHCSPSVVAVGVGVGVPVDQNPSAPVRLPQRSCDKLTNIYLIIEETNAKNCFFQLSGHKNLDKLRSAFKWAASLASSRPPVGGRGHIRRT